MQKGKGRPFSCHGDIKLSGKAKIDMVHMSPLGKLLLLLFFGKKWHELTGLNSRHNLLRSRPRIKASNSDKINSLSFRTKNQRSKIKTCATMQPNSNKG